MSAVLPYVCTCGEEYLIALREVEQAQEDVLRSATWGRTIQHVAQDLGLQYVDRRDTPSFVCANCETTHARG